MRLSSSHLGNTTDRRVHPHVNGSRILGRLQDGVSERAAGQGAATPVLDRRETDAGQPELVRLGTTCFDIRDPRDAARLAKEEQRLKAIGAEYYIAKGLTETTIRPEPDPRRVNSHR